MKIRVQDEGQLDMAVNAFLAFVKDVKVVLLYGDLGAGKTTFIKHLAKSLGATEEASSPTYSLVNEYPIPSGNIYHIDLYRLNDSHEAQDMGVEEYIYSGEYCFIEWPEVIEHLIDQAVVIRIETLMDYSRQFEIRMLNP